MSQAIYAASVESFIGSLNSLSAILALAATHENAATLPGARLAPDMFPLSTQVQLTCLHASSGSARLAGQDVGERPSMEEAHLAGLQAIIADTVAKLSAYIAADFVGAEERRVIVPLQPPTVLDVDGAIFLHRWLLPNFYFHYVTAYDILRHNGLTVGKKNFLSGLAGFVRQAA